MTDTRFLVRPSARWIIARSGRFAASGWVAAIMLGGGGAMAFGQDDVKPESTPQPTPSDEVATVANPPTGADGQDPPINADGQASPPPNDEEQDAPLQPTPGFYTFQPQSEPWKLHVLVENVRDTLGIPIMALDNALKDDANAQIVINVPITFEEAKILSFVRWMLETKGYTIVRNEFNVYVVQAAGNVNAGFAEGEFSPTVLLPTGVLQPTEAKTLINEQMSQQAQLARITANDELGLLIITGPQGVVSTISDFIERLSDELTSLPYSKFEVVNISAVAAYSRMANLLATGTTGSGGAPVVRQPATRNAQGGDETNQARTLASNSLAGVLNQVSIDPTGNALLFRGRPEDAGLLTSLLKIVDVPNTLEARWYPAGAAAEAVAQEGRLQGLGDVTVFESGGSYALGNSTNRGNFAQNNNQSAQSDYAGAGFTLYPEQGGFIYRGTPSQQAQVKVIIEKLSELITTDTPVYEFYRLKFAKAEEVVEIMNNLVLSRNASGSSSFVGSNNRRRTTRDLNNQENQTVDPNAAARVAAGDIGEISTNDAEDIAILDDKANNQVLVKAPKRLQPTFAKLIEKLDLRRAQVYVEAKIVAVQANDQFRLAVEQQWINAGGTGGAFNSNFGLSSFATGSSLLSAKTVGTGALGATAAIIKSDMVPIVVTALQQDVRTRIISSPQILVDNNAEDASVSSIDRIPTTVTSQTNSSTITSQGNDAEAGTKLTVKPQISDDGSVKLDFEVELSAFTGTAATAGQAPPSQENKINATSVTVPADSTIVVGGLTFESQASTEFKIPLLGDLPIVGAAFKDQRKETRKTTLYVFITPRALQNPTPVDSYKLLVEGPASRVGLDLGLPEPEMERAEIVDRPFTPAPLLDSGSDGANGSIEIQSETPENTDESTESSEIHTPLH